jgi:fibronectin type 3 domain-containing protein
VSPSPSPTPKPPVRGFWVYRRAKDGAYTRPLQPEVLTAPEFEDRSVAPGEHWCYVVRFLASQEPLVESESSAELCTTFEDIAPPAAPIGVSVVARGDGGVDVSWSPSSEGDLQGYRVYRATPPAEPSRLQELPPAETSFRDASARSGALHVYTVTAFDRAGNESPRSTPVQVRP